ncbi:hypothetical protein FFLO_02466 [Filobasidium floriforme]|uniref:Uncharacterized protein n=1 Tax=Filobasidium floriforme TaxID=5210 RepID=A0A8K0JN78_9TREE|nr:hypothetical protein FFLO_02466 [Filobasidium floriforme]
MQLYKPDRALKDSWVPLCCCSLQTFAWHRLKEARGLSAMWSPSSDYLRVHLYHHRSTSLTVSVTMIGDYSPRSMSQTGSRSGNVWTPS